ncbi:MULTISPECIES: CdaR family transcriptional regulator [Kribbella]|uniref:PucR-like helix-turn-helix protein n=1 Tax=Kribbella pratensis TaxID=2512112 RepID=A0ABY2FJW5_9ACTN|nr:MULTISPECIES: helix-turn-helix domain-containing protein [Kribbella]TDW86501.1 PucR-like helix-turn-helix protein [Kribbella sp. VKM Ac-2566]TDW93424.1 PucR-like helix-turn-helix protein [Kribbella pratensis]
MSDNQPTDLADLAAWAESQLPQLAENACTAILARVPFYHGGAVVSVADLRRSVGHNLRFLVSALRAPEEPRDLAAPRDTGRRRAQQSAPLPEVLQAYRICFATLWDALVAHARESRGQSAVDALLSAASLIWQFTDEHALAVTEAYRAATAEILLARQQRRGALVEALLTGQPGPDGGPWEAASLLGLPPGAQLIVVAAETRGLAEESLPGIERRLSDRGVVSGWRLTPALQLGLVAVPLEQQDRVLSTLRETVTARTGVSPPYPSLSDTPRALHLARTALSAVPAGRAEVRLFDPSPLAALLALDPAEGRRITQAVLGTVLALPSDDRAILLETLTAYLNHDGSAEHAGRVLHCHPNTVRYRLRRLQELTGRSLSDPNDAAELAAASYAVQISPDATTTHGHN